MHYSLAKRVTFLRKVAFASIMLFLILSIFSYALLKKHELSRGLQATYYQNASFSGKPAARELSGSVNLKSANIDYIAPSRTNYSIEWQGYLQINEAGLYEFTTVSDDGSLVYIDHILVVDNSGFHPLKQVSGRVFLLPGFHSMCVGYCQGAGTDILLFYGNKLGTKEVPIAGEQLFPSIPSYPSLMLDQKVRIYHIVLRAIWGFVAIFILLFLISKIIGLVSKKRDVDYYSLLKRHYPLIIIVTIGFIIRLIGINYGLPKPLHPDERQIMRLGLKIAAGDLNPHVFVWPTLYLYLTAIAYKFSCWLLWVLQYFFGFIHPFKKLYLLISSNQVTAYHYYLISRSISIILGTITIPVTYLIGR